MENSKLNSIVLASLVLGVSLLIGTFIVSQSIISAKKLNDTLTVSGSAKMKVVSDSAKWHAQFSRNVLLSDIKNGYALMKNDETLVNKFLVASGLKAEEINISAVTMNQIYKQNSNDPLEYTLQQSVEISSPNVAMITKLSKNIQPIIDQGVIFSTQQVEYFTGQLPALRVSLLSDAIKDAKDRAGKIAESSGKNVGAIQSAAMGVVQVMPVNSVDISDYGNYDTSTIDKEVMVTVKTIFRLE
jgi:hypothetical protein